MRIYADPDPVCHFDADQDPTFRFDADPDLDPDPAYHLDADPDPAYRITLMRIGSSTLMRTLIWIRIRLIT